MCMESCTLKRDRKVADDMPITEIVEMSMPIVRSSQPQKGALIHAKNWPSEIKDVINWWREGLDDEQQEAGDNVKQQETI